MPANCNRKNPLNRSGTHQGERRRPALDPAYFRVDERDTADLILFAGRFSRHLNYYTAANGVDGDWLPFFTIDPAAILAGLSELPVASFQKFARSLQAYLAAYPSRSDGDLSAHFKLYFHMPLLLLKEAGDHFDRLPRDHALREFTLKVMARDVAVPLAEVVAYYKGALALADPPLNATPLVEDTPPSAADYNTTFDDSDPRIQLPSALTERFAGATALSNLALSDSLLAGIGSPDWATFYAGVDADTSPYEDSLGSFYNQIYDALTFNLLDKALERLFQALQRIALEAGTHLQTSLTAFAGHTPHYALWLAFLRLFKVSQDHLNTLTGRHLDYYYREVLQLCPQAARPGQVHLLFELNKNVPERLLPAASTFFRAGKDATGKEVQYRLDADFVVNRGRVAALKALHLRPAALPFASEVANSSDGLGGALPKEDPQWPPFGPLSALAARIGFAVADRQLFLREGDRTIRLTVEFEQELPASLGTSGLKAALTAPEGWLELTAATAVELEKVDDYTVQIIIHLSAEEPPVVPYDSAVHGEGFSVTEPMLKLEFAFATTAAAALFSLVRNHQFNAFEISVAVSDVRNITVQNESGVIDPSKPFLPFGPTPATNSALVVGSSELFSKRLASLTLHVQWEQAISSTGFFLKNNATVYKGRLRHLKQSVWTGTGGYDIFLFPATGDSIDITIPSTQLAGFSTATAQTMENEPLASTSQSGFIKLELNTGFGHSIYLDQKTWALVNLAQNPSWAPPATYPYNYDGTTKLPRQPYTPKINEITLSYATEAQTPAHFFHLHPFGFKEESNSSGRLFPELAHEGELYIGVADLAPPQRLTLLFQVVDGTANPLKEETPLRWSYLHGDEWVELAEQAVDDKTNNLTGSGIAGIAVPEDADTAHTVMPAGLYWFRMAAEKDADALNNLLTIEAQAATATFVNQGNDPQFLATPLAPGVITKLKTSDAAIKKITQPYASFGGKPRENEVDFTVRASERLRHKDRAVTMWDYEHLVLQAFPSIYKVRCINHTQLVRDAANNILADNEVKPGHVLVVTIPYLKGAGARDPLRPYTDKKTLGEIDRFLRQHISPFVQLEVQNPKFEEVQVKFKVAFTADIADIAFYQAELNAAIVRYLSPWAYDEGAEISFGGRWHKSAIIDFVEEQPYVDFVKDFEMYHKVDIALSDNDWVRIDEEVVEASVSRSILVSHPNHLITEI